MVDLSPLGRYLVLHLDISFLNLSFFWWFFFIFLWHNPESPLELGTSHRRGMLPLRTRWHTFWCEWLWWFDSLLGLIVFWCWFSQDHISFFFFPLFISLFRLPAVRGVSLSFADCAWLAGCSESLNLAAGLKYKQVQVSCMVVVGYLMQSTFILAGSEKNHSGGNIFLFVGLALI